MRKLKLILSIVLCVLFCHALSPVFAATSASNDKTGYVYILDDSADFLTDEQENALASQMYDLTAYCNVAFVTTTSHSKYSTEDFAADYFDEVFGPHENGTIFVIDRCLNEIYLYSDGSAHKTITNSRAYSITDNTYIYATSSYNYDYYTCARETFDQIQSLMEGRRIAEPMRYICSALLAVILALFVNFFFVMYSSRSRKPNRKNFLSGAYTQVQMQEANAQFDHQTRTYSPQSSSSSGGGGHSGGGGGHSGGGGGHSI